MALDFNVVALDSVEAKGGYGIGLQIGQQLAGSGMEVEAEAVARGIFYVLYLELYVNDFCLQKSSFPCSFYI